ncbi:type VI secretion system tube protein Hcp [Roseateles sp.]|uniref:Hcp family type VI secretion system effector n=2 Tax=Roseateles sp. TaxID=1971397 RepID=UPI003265CC36
MSKKDMFLKLDSKRGGAVKGESEDPSHPAEMVVQGFSWGMTSTVSTGFSGKETKPAQLELRIVKHVDSASTGLMSVMKSNDEIKKAVLTVRKAGGKAEDYFTIAIQGGRITALEVSSEDDSPHLTERLSLTFNKIEVQYKSQNALGGLKGASTFQDEVTPG